jgi:hypothetical protein
VDTGTDHEACSVRLADSGTVHNCKVILLTPLEFLHRKKAGEIIQSPLDFLIHIKKIMQTINT